MTSEVQFAIVNDFVLSLERATNGNNCKWQYDYFALQLKCSQV